MAIDWEKEYAYIAQALPTPTDTPYRTPTGSMSRLSLHRRDSSPGPSSSPPPFSPGDRVDIEGRGNMVDPANDETISPLDPRRFTPTLHASLVSEILSLRRDLESKSRIIDTLEVNLENAKSEVETLNEALSKNSKENRSLKMQMQLLEGSSLSAVNELTKERDEALESITDFRKRLDLSQKRTRTQQEELERAQQLWERERQRWEEDRRNLERKVHVVEGRLKVVLNEVAAAQAANSHQRSSDGDLDDSTRDATLRGSDTTSIRSNSVLERRRTSTASVGTHDGEPNHLRYSVMSLVNGHGAKLDGLNLADELALDEEEEDDMDHVGDEERPDSRATFFEARSVQIQARTFGIKARRVLGTSTSLDGVESIGPPGSPERLRIVEEVRDIEETGTSTTAPLSFEYRDIGIQYTPPPSPKQLPEPGEPVLQPDADTALGLNDEHDIGQGGKLDSLNMETCSYQSKDISTGTSPVDMISTSCQTTGELPSPPITPKGQEQLPSSLSPALQSYVVTTDSSTQTNDVIITDKETAQLEEKSRFQMPIPMIAIHPPLSNPPSPRNSVVLPPQTKNVSCQTEPQPATDLRSFGIQTEEIRVDKRPIKLPASLLPSAIPDQPASPDFPDHSAPPLMPGHHVPPRATRRKLRSPPPVEPAPARVSKGKEPEMVQAYPGNNDNGPLAEDIPPDTKPDIRRPFRTSSLFAGFQHISDEEWPETGEEMFNEDDIFNRPMASYTLRSGKLVSKPTPVADDGSLKDHDEQQSPQSATFPGQPAPNGSFHRSAAREKSSAAKRPPRPLKLASGSRQPDIRRTAMISNSTAAHQSRPRSPSAPSIGSIGSSTAPRPPFPVPIRLSSRKIPISVSEGAQSPTPYGNGAFPRRRRLVKSAPREQPLRKVRSAAAVPRMNQGERRSNSPPAPSTSSAAPDSPQPPPMPFDDITAPRNKRAGNQPSHHPTASRTFTHARGESTTTVVQQTSVVDAIAQTMVGEWMWKYVRRRKSFGVTEQNKDGWELGKTTEGVSANITGTGVRHRRWVWLAPYERAVMWSSKQPTSGPALLGKSGRKLTIQSVLDVKDDNPLPKGSGPQSHFNRSILILTPQRALKFTAVTLERHFVWLTALSFLSHSTMGVNDLAALPPVPKEEYIPPPPAATLRRNPIRDSIRVAKSKTRSGANPNRLFTIHPTSVPEIPYDEPHANEPIADAADAPCVPRVSSHVRKRSNTAPRPPPSAFRSFSHATVPSTHSATTAGSSDIYSPSSVGHPGIHSGQSSFSHRTSEASGRSNFGMANFFEAIGTVRMEAFVDRQDLARHRGGHRSRHGGKRKEPTYWIEPEFPRSEDTSDVFYRSDDPFRGF